MTITQTITAMPPVPDPASDSADEFSDKAAATVLAQKNMVPELNTFIGQANATAVEVNNNAAQAAASQAAAAAAQASAAASAASAIAAPGTNATSATSLTVGSGTVSITVQTGKSFVPGMWGNLARTSDRSKWMLGYIDSYNAGTGALVLIVAAADVAGVGSGPYSDWTFTLSAARIGMLSPVDLSLVGPSSLPSLLADFANSKWLPAGFVYTMASPQSYFDAVGVMRIAAANVPAFDHNPVTRESLGISLWERRTNYAVYSDQFDNALWTKTNCTISPNSRLAPDGTIAMDMVSASAGNAVHVVSQPTFTASAGLVCTNSIFAAAGTVSWIALGFDNASTDGAYFDLSTGLKGVVAAGTAAEIEPIGNGIYRCSVTRALPTGPVYLEARPHTADGQASGWNAAGTETIYIWGADSTIGAFTTPYIPNPTSEPVTRNSPLLYIDTNSSWFNSFEGTLFSKARKPATGGPARGFAALVNSISNSIFMYQSISGLPQSEIISSGVGSFNKTALGDSILSMAIGYKNNDSAFSVNGAGPLVDPSVTIPAVNRLYVGEIDGTGYIANTWIAKAAYWPRRLPNAELTALTTK